MEKNTKRKVSVEELNELSIVGGNDGNPEPRWYYVKKKDS